LHGRGAPRGVDEPYGFVARERADPNSILNFHQHNARGDPSRVGEGLSAKHRRGCAGRAGHDGEQVAHPIENHNCDVMRCTEPERLDAHESAPAGHHDSGRHPRAGVVAEAAVAVVDKERAALDGEAGVVGLYRDHAGLNRKTSAPESIRFSVCSGVGRVRSGRTDRPRLRQSGGPRLKRRLPAVGRPLTSGERVAPVRLALNTSGRPGDS